MPAVKKINKEDIIKAGVEIVRKEGITNLNARKIASFLNCSTQPIYYLYSNMEELKDDVLKEISKIFDNAMLKNNYCHPVYKDIGKNYIRFAKDEPILFKLLFNSSINEKALCFIDLTGSSKQIFKTIESQTGMKEEDIKNFHLRMWLYVNGIANLVANNTINFTSSEIDELLKEQYLSMLLYEYQKGNVKKELIDKILKNKGEIENE